MPDKIKYLLETKLRAVKNVLVLDMSPLAVVQLLIKSKTVVLRWVTRTSY